MEYELFTLNMINFDRFEASLPDEVLPYIDKYDEKQLEKASQIIFEVIKRAMKRMSDEN
ncbi:MAG: hypothetical protein E6469_10570 [Clostridium perfringens]|nr:hypothetical protein [Clostridium perfringens]